MTEFIHPLAFHLQPDLRLSLNAMPVPAKWVQTFRTKFFNGKYPLIQTQMLNDMLQLSFPELLVIENF